MWNSRKQRKQGETALEQATERWKSEEREQRQALAEDAHQAHLQRKLRRIDEEAARNRQLDRARFEAERDRPPHESDSDPEANLEAILSSAPLEDSPWAPPTDADAPEQRDPAWLWDIAPIERHSDASEPPPQGQLSHDPLVGARREQAKRDAWTDHVKGLQQQQEEARQRREAEASARRAAQASKRGAMKKARRAVASVTAQVVAKGEALGRDCESTTLKELLPALDVDRSEQG